MPAGTKRKRTAKKKSGSTSRQGRSISKKARMDLNERQYFQGLSGPDFGPWFGCGSSLLRTPNFTFQSPVDGLMRFEIDSGENPEGPGGGLRLCGPCEDLKDALDSPTFMVPFQHVEQLIIIDEPGPKKSAPSTNPAYRAIIIPTAAVGASILRRTYPKVISFTLPHQKAGTDFKGKIGEAADDPDEKYHSLLTRVFNEELAPFSKSVIDASSATTAEKSDAHFTCDAAFKQESDAPQKPVNGKLFFLETGILFHSQTVVLYLTAESTPTTMLVSNYEISSKRPGPVNLTLVCPTSEPYYENGRESQQGTSKQHKSDEPLFISFHDIAVNMFDRISQYAERYGIEVNDVEQEWYSLKKNEPMTGWDPPGMRPRRQ